MTAYLQDTCRTKMQIDQATQVWTQFFEVLPIILQTLTGRDPILRRLFQEAKVDWQKIIKTPYVALVGAIVGQKIRYTQARKIRGKLYQRFGINFTPSDLEAVSDSVLMECGINPQVIAILRRINAYLETNQIEMKFADEIKKLDQVEGIGPWTINTAILTTMQDWTLFPTNDVFIKNRVKRLYQMKNVPTIQELEMKCQSWAPYQGIVCWYLWRWFPSNGRN